MHGLTTIPAQVKLTLHGAHKTSSPDISRASGVEDCQCMYNNATVVLPPCNLDHCSSRVSNYVVESPAPW